MRKTGLITAVVALLLATGASADILASWTADGIDQSTSHVKTLAANPSASGVVASDAVLTGTGYNSNKRDNTLAGGVFHDDGELTWNVQASGTENLSLSGIKLVLLDQSEDTPIQLQYNTDGGESYTNIGSPQTVTGTATVNFDLSGTEGLQNIRAAYFRLIPNNSPAKRQFFWTGIGDTLGATDTGNAGNDIEISGVVPEPATMSLLGLGGLVAIRRRRHA